MSKILTVENLSVSIGHHPIIKNLDFELNQGETLAIIGPNGSGKTILLKTLLNLITYQGTITWHQSARVGYVPQKIDADRHLPINLKNLLEAKAHIIKAPHQEITAAIQAVRLSPEILKIPIGHLSGGQFQKALIALALLGNPNVILFDEPTASLDELSEEHVYDFIQKLQKERHITVVLVSHDIGIVSQYATRVLCLNKEKICFGTPSEALTPDVLKLLYGPAHTHHHSHGHHHPTL